jgi:hypothetical protein
MACIVRQVHAVRTASIVQENRVPPAVLSFFDNFNKKVDTAGSKRVSNRSRRDGVKNTEDKSTVWIYGDKEKVWQAITDAEKLTQWYAPGSPWEIPNLKTGEKVIFTLKPNKYNHLREDLPLTLTIKDVVPYEKFSLYVELHDTILTFNMKENDNGIEVTINSGGYNESLANLKALVEGKALPYLEWFW